VIDLVLCLSSVTTLSTETLRPFCIAMFAPPLHCQFGYGWDASVMEYCDLMERGVIDPAKVTINAIENSASVAGLVLTTECLVTTIPINLTEEDKQRLFDQQAMSAGMGPGIR